MATENTTTTALARVAHHTEMSVQDVVDRKRKIVEVMQGVMKEGEHYGKIPGCGDKPTLFKAGAEVLAFTFALAPKFKIEQVDLGGGHREYKVTCVLVHIPTGNELGEGVGSCSTMESKYRWRNAQRKCPQCGQATILKSKKDPEYFCWAKKGGCGATWPLGAKEIEEQEVGRVENPDVADTWNTVLKMAKKRAQVDCTLTAVGASDLLAQDLEDLPPGSQRNDRYPDAIEAEFSEVGGAVRDDARWTGKAPGGAYRDADLDRSDEMRNAARASAGKTECHPNAPTQQPRTSTQSADHDKADHSQTKASQLDAVALDLVADIEKAPVNEAFVKGLAPRFASLPKGTAQREMAAKAYNAKLEACRKQQAANGAA